LKIRKTNVLFAVLLNFCTGFFEQTIPEISKKPHVGIERCVVTLRGYGSREFYFQLPHNFLLLW